MLSALTSPRAFVFGVVVGAFLSSIAFYAFGDQIFGQVGNATRKIGNEVEKVGRDLESAGKKLK